MQSWDETGMLEHAGADAIATDPGPRNRVSEAVAQRCGGDKAEVVARLVGRAEPSSRPVPIARRSEGDRCRVAGQLVYQVGKVKDRSLHARGEVVHLARFAAQRASDEAGNDIADKDEIA